ncbi:hypothetical protein HAX54_050871 [Datura stramonium]|uniref:Transmembrane protein n=1 Tax=Datura stramonium TaxID=4076 RepID=A0ABS8SX06_DATST|nr:hypothetical protein [Datura stramonium]
MVIIELMRSNKLETYKIQPKIRFSLSEMMECYGKVLITFVFAVGPLQFFSFPIIEWVVDKDKFAPAICIRSVLAITLVFLAPYAHWAEIIIWAWLFLGPLIVPCHMFTFLALVRLATNAAFIETHSGYEFPWSPSRYIPFYGEQYKIITTLLGKVVTATLHQSSHTVITSMRREKLRMEDKVDGSTPPFKSE